MSYELSEERVIPAHKPPTLRSIGLAVAAAALDSAMASWTSVTSRV